MTDAEILEPEFAHEDQRGGCSAAIRAVVAAFDEREEPGIRYHENFSRLHNRVFLLPFMLFVVAIAAADFPAVFYKEAPLARAARYVAGEIAARKQETANFRSPMPPRPPFPVRTMIL